MASLMPASPADRRCKPDNDIITANGTAVNTFGTCTAALQRGGHHFTWTYVLTDINKYILGSDFRTHYRLMIDPAGHRLIHRLQGYKITRYLASSNDLPVSEVSTPPEYDQLLEEFPDLMHHIFKITKPKHGIELPISTVGPPVHSQMSQLAPDKYMVTKRAFEDMEASGIVQRSRSTWSSGLHLIPKLDGGL